MANEATANCKPSGKSILLGLFVLFQMVYLPLSNLSQLVPRELPPQHGEFDIRVQCEGTLTHVRLLQEGINGLGIAVDRWGEFSGQVQAWSMFAPDFGTQSIFPEVACCWEDRLGFTKIVLKPKIIPNDPEHYARWPSQYSRLFSYEFLLAVIYLRFSEESLMQRGDEWRQAIRERVRTQQRSLEAYFRWNFLLFKKQYPELPTPTEMILQVVVLPSPKPGENNRPPSFKVALARWVPERIPESRFLPIEAYDPVTRQFIRLPSGKDGP